MKYIFLIMFCSVLLGCGKSEMPRPVTPTNLFSIEKAEILVYENCLIAKVFFNGSYTSLYQVVLELEERNNMESEEVRCPIQPTVVEKAPLRELNKMNEENNFLLIQYCPKKPLKSYYRWRIKANHYLYKLSPEYSPIETITTLSE